MLVSDISDNKTANVISTKLCGKELEKSNAMKCNLLAKLIKANESENLANLEENAEDELEKTRSILASNNDMISSHKRWKLPKVNISEVKISLQLTRSIHLEKEQGDNDSHVEPPAEEIMEN